MAATLIIILNNFSATVSSSMKQTFLSGRSLFRHPQLGDILMSNFWEAARATLAAADQSDSLSGGGGRKWRRRIDSSCLN